MLLFRSEEDLDQYSAARGTARGTALPIERAWALSKLWFGCGDPVGWRWPTAERARGIFEELGLTGPAWVL